MLRVIDLLSDGQFHSGQALGNQLNLTRSAVWKLIKQLSRWGINVETRIGKGYRIPDGIMLLNKKNIQQHIDSSNKTRLEDIEIFLELPSTNDYLINNHWEGNRVCLAERQTMGKGRRGRPWFSPFASNIYLSMLWHFPKDMSELSGLSLTVATAILKTLHHLHIEDIHLKWPNDILWQGKKLAGILIESMGEIHGVTRTIIGIGLNVSMSDKNRKELTNTWTDLFQITGKKFDRNLIVGHLINELIKTLLTFQSIGFGPFQENWLSYDYYLNKAVSLITPTETLQGISRGINHLGHFLLETKAGEIKAFSSGELSLRLTSEQ